MFKIELNTITGWNYVVLVTREKIQSLNDIGFVWSAKVPWKPHERSKDGDGSESVESASDDCSNMKADDNDYGKKPTAIWFLY